MPAGRRPRRAGDRECLAAIIFVAASGQWSRARLHRVILGELGARSERDWSRCAIDRQRPGLESGPLTGPNPTGRDACTAVTSARPSTFWLSSGCRET